jgi:hypothetical protein
VLKSLVLLFALLLALQALAIAARAFLRLTGRSGQPVYRGAERP